MNPTSALNERLDIDSTGRVEYNGDATPPGSEESLLFGSEQRELVLPPVSIQLPVNPGISFHFNNYHDIKNEVQPRPPEHSLRVEIRRRFKHTVPSASIRYAKNETAYPRPMRFSLDSVLSSSCSALCIWDQYNQDGWRSFTHPEGLRYYYHGQRRVLTDANLQDGFVYTKINDLMNELFQICRAYSIDLPQSCEIVLELYPDNTCAYYVADNEKKTIFFLDDVDTSTDLQLPDVVSTEHLKLQLHRQYWRHIEYFPSHRAAPKSVQSELKATLSHAWADGKTSDLSTSPYSPEMCHEFLQILNSFTGKPEHEPYRTCIIGRVMDEFTQARFINLYGESRAVRLSSNQSILASESESESESASESSGSNFTLYEFVSIMLLRQPDKELDRLNNIWVDKIAYTASWRRFIRERVDEWKNVLVVSMGFTVIDTLLVLFLRGYASTSIWSNSFPLVVAYQLSLTSLSTNICSICIGLAAISSHRHYYDSTASNAASYFTNAWHEKHGFKPHAIALSLPRALAIWAIAGTTLSIASLSLESLNLANLLFSCCFTISLTLLLTWSITYFQNCDERNSGYMNVFAWLAERYPGLF